MTEETKQAAEIMTEAENISATPEAAPPTPRRGRGRPSKAEKAGDINNPPQPKEIPASGATTAAKPKSRAKKAEINVSELAAQIHGMHAMISMMTGLAELQIHEKEAEALAKGVVAVTEQYGFEISGKTGASLQLFAAAAMVYAPRVFAIKARMAHAKAQSTVDTSGLPAPAAPAGEPQFPN